MTGAAQISRDRSIRRLPEKGVRKFMATGPDSNPIRMLALSTAVFLAIAVRPNSCNPLFGQEIPAMSAMYQIEKGSRKGWLIVTVDVPEGCHIYALTQKGSPPPTKIKLEESKEFELLEGFRANKEPHVVEHDPVFGQRVESYEAGKVKLIAPVRIADEFDVEKVSFDLKFHGQVCSAEGCKPIFNHPLKVTFGGFYDPPPPDKDKGEKKKEDVDGSR